MNSIDILFWFLVALMGGVAWAVEAGLAYRHRNLLASSVLAAFGAGIIIMFWIEDKTSMEYNRPAAAEKKKKKAKDQGQLQQEDVEVEQGSSSSNGGGTPAAAANNASSGDAAGKAAAKKDDIEIDEKKLVYSRTPFKDCPECPDLVILPEGSVRIGTPPDEPGRGKDENPPSQGVIDKPYAVGRIEILRREFQAFAEETAYTSSTQCNIGSKRRGKFTWKNPGFEQDERHAVTCLTVEEVNLYLAWLSKKTGRTYRLPSELEWEYAARSGTVTPYWTGDTLWRHQGNFGRSRDGTTVAGSFEMNNFGLSDVAGNVWELTSECMSSPQAAQAPGASPTCDRVIKGGGWNSAATTARHGARSTMLDATATNFVGFRVVRSIDERDNDKLLTKAQRLALARDEKLAKEIKDREEEAIDKAKRDAREAAAMPPAAKAKAKAGMPGAAPAKK